MLVTTRECGHPKMTDGTGIATRGGDLATMTIMAPTIKYLQNTKKTIIKEMTTKT
jgi:hypothetical protein